MYISSFRNEDVGLDEAHIKFPVVDIVQNVHDIMFSKLFYSWSGMEDKR